jgi:hypothetical protein
MASVGRRHSEVQRLLREAAATQTDRSMRARPSEFDRLRDTIRQMRQETASGYSALGGGNGEAQRLLMDRLGSLQRAVECLSETLEDEVSALRSSTAAQADQIKLLTSQLSESDSLRSEVSDLRRELKSAVSALRSGEHTRLAPQLAELQAELEAVRAAQADERRGAAAERKQLAEELAGLRQWRAETVHPLLEASERSRAAHRGLVDEALPQLRDRLGQIEAEAASWPPLRDRLSQLERTVATLGTEVSAVAGQLVKLTDVHNYAVGSLEAGLGRLRDEAHQREINLDERMQADESRRKAELLGATEAQAQSAQKRIGAEEEARRAAEAAMCDQIEVCRRSVAAASVREAETMEALLSLQSSHAQAVSWMEAMQVASVRSTGQQAEAASKAAAADAAARQISRDVTALNARVDETVRYADETRAELARAAAAAAGSVDRFRKELRADLDVLNGAIGRSRQELRLVLERWSETGAAIAATDRSAAASPPPTAGCSAQHRAPAHVEPTYSSVSAGLVEPPSSPLYASRQPWATATSQPTVSRVGISASAAPPPQPYPQVAAACPSSTCSPHSTRAPAGASPHRRSFSQPTGMYAGTGHAAGWTPGGSADWLSSASTPRPPPRSLA